MHVLQADVPLSESMVWRLQRTFYADQGIAAWSRSNLPQSVTTSPIIARAYARIVLGYWRDIGSTLDPSEPIYVVELGAGSGRFAYRFLKALGQVGRFVYVMTDASASVVDFWRDNQRLRPFVEAGLLDFALFDVAAPAPLTLLNSGASLGPGPVANPIVLVANYIFDSIPQDALTIKNGQLFSNLVTVSASRPELDLTAPDDKVRISITFKADDTPVDVEREPDAVLRSLLEGYRARLDDTTVLIPRAGFDCLRFFWDLAGQRGLCLTADFGDTHEDQLRDHGPPGFGAGGGFWLAVNFHALGEYTRGLGGYARHPRARHARLNISLLQMGLPRERLTETELAYSDVIDHVGPDDLYVLSGALAEHLPHLKLDALFALLRVTGWDSNYVMMCLQHIVAALPNASDKVYPDVVEAVQRAWEQYYPIGEPHDVPFALGVLMFTIQRYPEALEFFQTSLSDFGDDPRTTLNLALCLYHLDRLPETLHWLDRTLALEPDNETAHTMRASIAGASPDS